MAARMDILSFVTKYLDLWQSGHEAKLCLSSKAGISSVQLSLEIDLHCPRPPYPRPRRRSAGQAEPRQPGPSRCRRRARRAEEHGRRDAAKATCPSSPPSRGTAAAARATPPSPSGAKAVKASSPSPPCGTIAARALPPSFPPTGSVASQATPSPPRSTVAEKAVSPTLRHPTEHECVHFDESVHVLATKNDDTETHEEFQDTSTVQAFYTSTPQKDYKPYRQNCTECFQNSVCVDCYVGWHKAHSKKRKRDPDYV